MKLAIVFEVPDDQADTYAEVADKMIQRHAFAQQEKIEHWSFDLAMRPVAAVVGETDTEIAERMAFSAKD